MWVDATGTEVEIPGPPMRIASLTLMTDEILVDLEVGERLVAVTSFADDPEISNVVDRAGSVPHRLTLNAEELIALSPDLALVAAWSNPDVVRQLRAAGTPVFALQSPRSIEEVRETIRTVARLVARTDVGEELLETMDRRLGNIESAVATVPEQQRLLVLDYSPGGTSFGSGSSWDDIVGHAGLVNAAARFGADRWGNVRLSQEQVLAIDPDLIVLPGWSWDDPQATERFYRSFVEDPAFAGLRAVRGDRVMIADERHRMATSHYIVEAVFDLASFAYPELFR
jgi:iron complex transport system substrate-binding protein